MTSLRSTVWTVIAGMALSAFSSPLRADDPASRDPAAIARQIDQHVGKKLAEAKINPSAGADDAEFLRRAYLDITGKIPSADKTAAFLDSSDPDKRAKLIDELLAASDYGRHFAIIWRTALIKRDEANRILNPAAYTDWLAKSFNDNRGWDKIVRDMLTAEGSTADNPAGLFFLANRDMTKVDPAKVVGAATNMFLGIQMQCAECHNHPFIRQWKQTDFWGMAAFFSRTRDTATPQKGNKAAPTGNISESTASTSSRTAPKLPFGKGRPGGGTTVPVGSIAIPSPTEPGRTIGIAKAKLFEGEEPRLDPSKPFRPVFAEWLTSPANKYFARSAVNRMWNHLFARGLVMPIEDMHDDNEPSHPEVLKLLSDEFIASGFDLKHLIRCITLTETYQRTSQPTADNRDDDKLFSHQTVKVMSPDVMYDALTAALGAEPRFQGGPIRGGPPGGGGGRQAFINFFDTREDLDDLTDTGHGIPQYLRLMNASQFNQGGKITEQLVREKVAPERAVEKLFLHTLARRPTAEETARFTAYLGRQADARRGLDNILWVLINSAEFICVR